MGNEFKKIADEDGDTYVEVEKVKDDDIIRSAAGGVQKSYFSTTDGAMALPGYLVGLTLSNGTDTEHDIDIAVGFACSADWSTYLRLATAITKRLDASWAVGTGEGGLFTGTIAINTWYHVFLIKKDSDGSIDAGFDTSVSAANIPEGYTAYRRIGAVVAADPANIIQFTQNGDEFLWKTPRVDLDTSAQGTSAILRSLSAPPDIKADAIIIAAGRHRSITDAAVLITPVDVNDTAPTTLSLSQITGDITWSISSVQFEIRTNTSSQIRTRGNAADTDLAITTLGWKDHRGRDG